MFLPTRRRFLKRLTGGAAALGMAPMLAACASRGEVSGAASDIVMDGHVHASNRLYWENVDLWGPTESVGFDYARARASGINCVIENIGTYGFRGYNYTPKQALRLIETNWRYAEAHADRMAIALSPADARRIVASGRMAVFIGCESGIDHEGDPDVLGAMHRLGLRSLQFATQTGFNAFADSALAPIQGGQNPEHYGGINSVGRKLVARMNEVGVLIDLAHATEAAQLQVIAASKAPVVSSHDTARAVSGAGLSDDVIKRIAAKGGLVGIHGAATVVSKRYREWMRTHPEAAAAGSKGVFGMVGYQPSFTRPPDDHGEYIARVDQEFRERWLAMGTWKEDPSAVDFAPTADEWAEHVDYIIKLVGADHVAIGLDLVAGRSAVPMNANGYPSLVAAVNRVTTPANVRKICGENWMRVLGDAKAA